MTAETHNEQVVRETLDLLSKKWHPVVIQRLLEGVPLRFNELKDRLDGVSAKVLTDTLDDLVENDLVRRRVITESPRRVEYELTKHGRELEPVLDELATWGERNLGENPFPTILIVDDDPRLVEMHAGWLEDEYQVERAHTGREAIRKLDASVDVVLLDRRMPGLTGDEVLEQIRDHGFDCQVVVLSAVDPDLDVVDMSFDAYLNKPVVEEELLEVVADVLSRRVFDDRRIEYLSLLARRSVLLAEVPPAELETSGEYARLLDRIDSLEAELESDDEASDESADVRAVDALLDQ